MSNLAIIPARGGSKRIPSKNIKLFLGKPIIAYSIEMALESGLFDEVMVSTDNIEIVSAAEKYGAKVPFLRSNETSTDYATTYDVVEEVIQQYEKINVYFDFVCCLYPCAPLIDVNLLRSAFKILRENNYDCVLPVLPFSYPIQRALKIQSSNLISFFFPEFKMTRSQDFVLSYHDAGQFYFMKISRIIEKRQILTDNSGSLILNELEAQDIDNEIDWKMAEMKYKLKNNL